MVPLKIIILSVINFLMEINVRINENTGGTCFEELAGILSTWLFHAIFLLFNFSIFIAIRFKYGLFLSFATVDNSYYSVVYALV